MSRLKKTLAVAVATLSLALLALYVWHDRLPIIAIAVRAHAARGSINCGTVTNIGWINAEDTGNAAIDCAVSASELRKPFYVVFTGYGADTKISHALVSDANGRAIQIFYATGTADRPGLWKSRCDEPLKMIIQEKTSYRFPRVHCAPWPPSQDRLSRDFLLW